jgi:hypothetical protein
MSEAMKTFDPVLFSTNENKFLLEALGKPVYVAMQECPSSVNPKAVEPILKRVSDLEDAKKFSGAQWVGIDAMKEKINAYLRENAKWKSDNKRFRRAPRFPSMYTFDSRGKAIRGGVGSDSGRVRTYFASDGTRVPFEIPLTSDDLQDGWVPPTMGEKAVATTAGLALLVNAEANRIECFCGHTESFKPESRASYNAARARISKHLRRATERVDDHRELHGVEFS